MGVPVISLPGATMAGRMGASFIAAAGLPELVARDRRPVCRVRRRTGA